MRYIGLQIPQGFRFSEEIISQSNNDSDFHQYDISFPKEKACQVGKMNPAIGDSKISKSCYYQAFGDKMIDIRKSKRKEFIQYQFSLRKDGLKWLEELEEMLIDTEEQFDIVDYNMAGDYKYIIEDLKEEYKVKEQAEEELSSDFQSTEIDLKGFIADKISKHSKNTLPSDISECVDKFRKDYPEGCKTAFLIMQFTETGVHDKIVKSIKTLLKKHDIIALKANDKDYADDLFQNTKTYMHCCDFAIAIFERITEDDFNPNVSLEVGYLMGLNKPICLLKDTSLKNLPTDLAGKLYKPLNLFKIEESIKSNLTKWLKDKEIIR